MLQKVAIITFIIGITYLYIATQTISIPELEQNNITNELLTQKSVKASGTIQSIKKYNGAYQLTLNKSCQIETILFTNKELNLTKNKQITIEGEQQNNQIIIEKITTH